MGNPGYKCIHNDYASTECEIEKQYEDYSSSGASGEPAFNVCSLADKENSICLKNADGEWKNCRDMGFPYKGQCEGCGHDDDGNI